MVKKKTNQTKLMNNKFNLIRNYLRVGYVLFLNISLLVWYSFTGVLKEKYAHSLLLNKIMWHIIQSLLILLEFEIS